MISAKFVDRDPRIRDTLHMIPRILESRLLRVLGEGRKVVTLLGPRQVGKTTLLRCLARQVTGRTLVLNGDFHDDGRRLRPERAALTNLLGGVDFLFLDEAQNVDHVGTVLKLIHDEFPEVRVLATGSSSFDLTHRTGEPLTGRQIQFRLYPLSFGELSPAVTERETVYESSLLYGTYPEVVTTASSAEKVGYLRQLVADYLLKDVYAQVDVNRTRLLDVLRLLAHQVGSEVSLSEIGRSVQLDTKTVARYLDLLERAFVIIRLRGFSRNLRKEVAQSQKLYFLDLGIRNGIIQAFQPLEARDDIGRLWENYLVVERIKRNHYSGRHANYYFWRTYDRQEIDFVEECDGLLSAYEFKYSGSTRGVPRLWRTTYPGSHSEVVTRHDAHRFLAMAARC